METTNERLRDEAAQHRAETMDREVDSVEAEAQEGINDVKRGAENLADKADDKWEDAKDSMKEAWQDTKDKAKEVGNDIADTAHDAKEAVKRSLD